LTAISTPPGTTQAAGPARGGRAARLLRGRPDDPAWARPALLALLAATALLYLAGLSRNGWANEFYAAAVQAGTKSWKAFLFGSLDSSNFITVDKPAGFLWPMDLAARIFGLNSWSLLVPQTLEGVATVGVLYTTVRRWFGAPAGLIAGAVVATGNEGGAFGGAIGREFERELGQRLPDAAGAGRGFAGGMFGGATGITRLFQADMGGQITWLLPAALIALAAMLWISRRAPRTDRTRAAALVWGGWLLVTGLIFSYMSGIIHPYYTIALAPAIGALVGIGSVELWRVRHTWFARVVMAASLVITVIWAWFLLDRSPSWFPWLRVIIVIAGAAAAGMILAGPALSRIANRSRTALAAAPISLALIAALGGPLAYSIDTSATTQSGAIPSAGPAVAGSFGPGGGAILGREFPGGASGYPGGASGFPGGATGRPPAGAGGGFGGQADVSAVLAKLLEAGASGYRWAAATIGSTTAASMELGSNGVPVMAIGGFSGSDPAPSLAEFEKLVSGHEIHYFVSGGGAGGFGGFPGAFDRSGASRPSGTDVEGRLPGGFAAAGGPGGGSSDASQITAWVEAHFKSEIVGGTTVYDLSAAKAATGPSGTGTASSGAPARPSSLGTGVPVR
jgi:4-amino-4-deoxy-L-arabinose transferase-like glycosyltransferase